jgi:hypothetical protein
MARVSEELGGYGQFIEFVVHPPLPARVWDGERALARQLPPRAYEVRLSKAGALQ